MKSHDTISGTHNRHIPVDHVECRIPGHERRRVPIGAEAEVNQVERLGEFGGVA